MSTIIITIISLCAIGVVSAVILYFVAQKFKVEEDPRIDVVDGLLPSVNCGGCGYPGCRSLAEAAVKSDTLDGIYCPVGGADTMNKIAEALGREIKVEAPKIAVVKCNGNCDNRPRTSQYDGARSCAIQHSLYIGDTACAYGCLGCGDCVSACTFDAIDMDITTGLPVVNEKCVACGACVKACPRSIIELRKKGPKDRRIFVSCVNKDKGGVARKSCKVACIGCGKCVKECPFEAITLENNLAYIDFEKCRLCRKCVAACPTNAIQEVNFPARKVEVNMPKPTPAPKTVEKTTEVAIETPKVELDIKMTRVEEPVEVVVETPQVSTIEEKQVETVQVTEIETVPSFQAEEQQADAIKTEEIQAELAKITEALREENPELKTQEEVKTINN